MKFAGIYRFSEPLAPLGECTCPNKNLLGHRITRHLQVRIATYCCMGRELLHPRIKLFLIKFFHRKLSLVFTCVRELQVVS